MRLSFVITAATLLLVVDPAFSWIHHPTHHHAGGVGVPNVRQLVVPTKKTRKRSTLGLSSENEASASTTPTELPDYTGKTIYQRTFYRLAPGSASMLPNPDGVLLEERLRFRADPENPGYILPKGPRTYIIRKGTQEDEITDEIYRVNIGNEQSIHNGPGTMDTTIATVLYLAANPNIIQGNVLEVACETGVAGILGCIAARFAKDPTPMESPSSFKQKMDSDGSDSNAAILTVPKHKDEVFPPRMKSLTLSDEDGSSGSLDVASYIAKDFSSSKIRLKEVPWSTRIQNRRYQYYRTILGSDIDISYPSSRELARVVANSLLPSNPTMASIIESSSSSASSYSSSSSGSFGGLGMDLAGDSSNTNSLDEKAAAAATEPDPKYPPTFVHVCPDVRENTVYLRQFLEKGFKMNVHTDFIRMERLRFVFQTIPEDSKESDIEDLDLELKDEASRSYQCLTAVHHPDYTGDGSGEYFFPLESGEYEGGSRPNTYLEPEEGGSPW